MLTLPGNVLRLRVARLH